MRKRSNKYMPLPLNWSPRPFYTPATLYHSNGDVQGYADGRLGHEQYLQALQAVRSISFARHADRIRETKAILDGTASFHKLGYWEFPWEIVQENGPKRKSLLTIIRFIKKNHKTLTLKSPIWKWLDKHTEIYISRYSSDYIKVLLNGLNTFFKGALSFVSVTSNEGYVIRLKPLVYEVKHMVVPPQDYLSEKLILLEKDCYRSYYFLTKADMGRLLSASEIEKNKVGNTIYADDCYAYIGIHRQRRLLDRTKHFYCSMCDKIHFVEDKRKHKKIPTKTVCKNCQELGYINVPFTKTTVYQGYHSHKNWSFYVVRSPKLEDDLPMGIEIEMHPRKRMLQADVCMNIYKAQQELNKDWHEIYFERDGSLAEGGIELVSNPMTLKFAQIYWGKLLPKVREQCLGWKVKKVNGAAANAYGIHITTLKNKWSPLQLVRVVKFLGEKHNRSLLWGIAQRNYIYSSGYSLGSHIKPTLGDLGYNRSEQKYDKYIYSSSRYMPVNITSDKVEFRFFASTLNQESFLKNYEFLDSLWHWTKETSWNTYATTYIAWLAEHPQLHTRWPNLFGYLCRKEFFYKTKTNGVASCPNPYRQLFLKYGKRMILTDVTPDTNDLRDDDACVS